MNVIIRPAALILLFLLSSRDASAKRPAVIRLEAENADRYGVVVAAERPGFSGTGYVTGFDLDGDRVVFKFKARAGLYELRIRYALPSGSKEYEIRVNDENRTGMLAGKTGVFTEMTAGKYLLRDGENEVVVGKGWGWYELDRLEFVPASASSPGKPSRRLADHGADAGARALFDCLVDLYGSKTLAGQQDFGEIAYARSVTGREPAVGAFDLMEYSPSRIEHGSNPGDYLDRVIDWGRDGKGIVSLSWHWNAPSHLIDKPDGKEWWRGFYTEATTFDLEKALADPASEDYRLLLRDMDAIAVQLRRLQDAGIPVLWRPLHESQGGWFWWGARGPDPLVRLWRLMFERFTNHQGLHNLIWVFTSSTEPGAWYPGDRYVDVIGADIYTEPHSSMSGEWDALRRLYGSRKLIALTETGTLPLPDRMRAFEVRWSWFSVWSGRFLRIIPPDEIRSVYDHPDVVTRDRLPEFLKLPLTRQPAR